MSHPVFGSLCGPFYRPKSEVPHSIRAAASAFATVVAEVAIPTAVPFSRPLDTDRLFFLRPTSPRFPRLFFYIDRGTAELMSQTQAE